MTKTWSIKKEEIESQRWAILGRMIHKILKDKFIEGFTHITTSETKTPTGDYINFNFEKRKTS